MIRGLVSYADNPHSPPDRDGVASVDEGDKARLTEGSREEVVEGAKNGTSTAMEPSFSSSTSVLSVEAAPFVPSSVLLAPPPTTAPKNKKRKSRTVIFSASSTSSRPSASNRRHARNDRGTALESDLQRRVNDLEAQLGDAKTQRDVIRGQRDEMKKDKEALASEVARLQSSETKALLREQELQKMIEELEAERKEEEEKRPWRFDPFSRPPSTLPNHPHFLPPTLPPRPRSELGFRRDDRAQVLSIRNSILEEQLIDEQVRTASLSAQLAETLEERHGLKQHVDSAYNELHRERERAGKEKKANAEVLRLAQEQATTAAAAGRIHAQKAMSMQIEAAQARRLVEGLRKQVQEKLEVGEWYKKEKTEFEKKVTTLSERVETLESALIEVRSELDTAESDIIRLHSDNKQLAATHPAQTETISTLEKELAVLRAKVDELHEAAALLDELVAEQEETERKRKVAEEEAQDLRARLAEAERESIPYSLAALPYRTAAWTARSSLDLNLRILRWGVRRVVG